MANTGNAQKDWDKTRVKITVDVENNGAIEKQEIGFGVALPGPWGGDNMETTTLRKREAITIGNHNFDDVMKQISPVADLGEVEGLGAVRLTFDRMDKLRPEAVASQIGTLNEKLEERAKFRDLISKIEANPDLLDALVATLRDEEKRRSLRAEIMGGGE